MHCFQIKMLLTEPRKQPRRRAKPWGTTGKDTGKAVKTGADKTADAVQ
jgi:hypothetical protein